jgi:hypothetical protein
MYWWVNVEHLDAPGLTGISLTILGTNPYGQEVYWHTGTEALVGPAKRVPTGPTTAVSPGSRKRRVMTIYVACCTNRHSVIQPPDYSATRKYSPHMYADPAAWRVFSNQQSEASSRHDQIISVVISHHDQTPSR